MRSAPLVAGALLAVGLAACGRLGFDPEGPLVTPDAPVGSTDGRGTDAPPVPATPLVCNVPTTTPGTVADMNDELALAASNDAVIALSTDSTDVAQSWSYRISASGALVPAAVGSALATDCTGTLAIVDANAAGGVLTGWSNTAGGTDLQELTATGAAVGTGLGNPSAPASFALAASGIDGTLALLTVGSDGEVDAVTVDATGAPTGAPVPVISAAIGAGNAALGTAATGYVLSWVDPNPSPNPLDVELLGPDFAVVAGPATASTNAFDAEAGQVAWAPASNTYLAAWQDKNMSDNDEVDIRVFDGGLTPIASKAKVIATDTSAPVIAGAGSGFWLAAGNYDNDDVIVDAIGSDGTVTALTPVGSDPLAWAIAVRAGQPVIAWLLPDQLWLEAPCTQ